MRVVDDAVLAILRAIDPDDLAIKDGLVDVDNSTNVVTYPLPYAVYRSNIGDDDNRRLGGMRTRRSVFFDLTVFGVDRTQVKWAGEQIRTVLQGKRVTIAGFGSWRCELLESTRIFRDPDVVQTNGKPLFYARESYALSIALTQGSTP